MEFVSLEESMEDLVRFYPARKLEYLTEYELEVLRQIRALGGMYNAHAHLCRANTIAPRYLEHISMTPIEASSLPLKAKQNLVGYLHTGPAYTEHDLRKRMSRTIEVQIALGTTRLDTNIDATPDLPEGGLLAIRIALELKERYKEQIAIRVAPTPIFGFKEGTRRWDVFKEAAQVCDYLSGLPEKDGFTTLATRDGKIGFRRAIRRVIELGCELGKEVQFHLDQMNSEFESGTEILLEGLKWLDQPEIAENGPSIKIVHMVSPSAYDEGRFKKLLEDLVEHHIGVIVPPAAGISMRQLRSIRTWTHNSIARILECIKVRVPLWLCSDNICDVFVPQGDGDLLTEIKMAGHAVRLAPPSIWAKLATGTPLNEVDIATVGGVMYQDRKACMEVGPSDWRAAIE